jgi:signal transduction histidine kinase
MNQLNFSSKFFEILDIIRSCGTKDFPLTNFSKELSFDEILYLKAELVVRTDSYSKWDNSHNFSNTAISDIANCYVLLFVNPHKALELSQEILNKHSLSPDLKLRVKYWHADCHFLTGQTEEGHRLLKQILHLPINDPWKAEALTISALCHYFLNDLDQAMETHLECQKLLDEKPDRFLSVFNSSMALRVALKKCEPVYFDYFSQVLYANSHLTDEKRYSLRIHSYKALLLIQTGQKSSASEEWSKGDSLLPHVEMVWEKGQYLLMKGFGSILSGDELEGKKYLALSEDHLINSGSPLPYIADLEIAKLFNDWKSPDFLARGLSNAQVEIGRAIAALEQKRREPKFLPVKHFFEEAIDYCHAILYGNSCNKSYRSSLIISLLDNSSRSSLFASNLSEFKIYSEFVNKLLQLEEHRLPSLKAAIEDIIGFSLATEGDRIKSDFNLAGSTSSLSKIIDFTNRILDLNDKIRKVNEYRALAEISKEIGHDLQSPITVLKHLDYQGLGPENLEALESCIEKIEKINNTILDHARGGSLKRTPVKNLLQRIVNDKRIETSNKITIPLQALIPDHITCELEDITFLRVLSNLFNNCVEAGAEKIDVSAKVEEEFIEITIHDNGPGFSAPFLEKVAQGRFESTKEKGLGVGILSARRYVEAVGGKFMAKNNGGALIKLHIPIQYRPELLVHLEDDKYLRQIWLKKSNEQGVPLLSFATESDLYAQLHEIPKSAFFYLDVDLKSKENGIDVAHRLFSRGIKNIYLTTGFRPEQLKQPDFIRGVSDKTFPL